MMTQAGLWAGAGAATLTTIVAALADWRRTRRNNLDRVGWMPWQLISVMAFFLAVALAALAMRS